MNIAHHIYTGSDQVYGGEKSQLNFIEEMNTRDGVEATTILYKETDLVSLLKERQVPYEIISPRDPLPGPYKPSGNTSGSDLQWRNFFEYNLRLRRYLTRNEFDIVHYNNVLGFLLTRPALQVTTIPTVLHIRSKPREMRWYWKLSLLLATRAVCVSDDVYDSIEERLPGYYWRIIGRKLVRIHNGVRFQEMQAHAASIDREAARSGLGITGNEFAVGYVASIDERKNQLGFLQDVVTRVHDLESDVRFYFLGSSKDDEYRQRCLEYVSDNGLGDVCSFEGYQDDIEQWYVALDAVTLYSRREGLPRAVLEAMSFGQPVVTNATTGVEEIINSGQDGFIHESPDEFVNTLIELSEDEQRTATVAETARETVSTEFSMSNLTDDLLDLYRETS